MENLVAKFSKRASKDLLKKFEGNATDEEKVAITSVLQKRGVSIPTSGGAKNKDAVPKAEKKAPAKKVEKAESKRKSNKDIVSEFLSVGDTVEFVAKSRDQHANHILQGEVIKIYSCNRSKKDYVRLKAEGRIFHKTLVSFAPVEETPAETPVENAAE